jgi:hypothetical protein
MLHTQVAVFFVLATSCRASPLPQAQSYSIFTPGLAAHQVPLALSGVPLAISQAPALVSHAPTLVSQAPTLVSHAPTLVSQTPFLLQQPTETEHYVSKNATRRNVEYSQEIINTMLSMTKYIGRQSSSKTFNRNFLIIFFYN